MQFKLLQEKSCVACQGVQFKNMQAIPVIYAIQHTASSHGSDYEDFVFWNVMQQCLLPRSSGYQSQDGGSISSETMVHIYKTTQHHIPEEMKMLTVYQRNASYLVLLHSCKNYLCQKNEYYIDSPSIFILDFCCT